MYGKQIQPISKIREPIYTRISRWHMKDGITTLASEKEFNSIPNVSTKKPLNSYRFRDDLLHRGFTVISPILNITNLRYISDQITPIRDRITNKKYEKERFTMSMNKNLFADDAVKKLTAPAHGIKKVFLAMEDSFVSSTIKQIRSRFGIEMNIRRDHDIETITGWIKDHDPRFSYHIANAYSLQNSRSNKSVLMGIFIIKVADGTYMYVDAESQRMWAKDESEYSPLYIYLFGARWQEVFEDMTKFFEQKNTSTNKIYSIVGVKDGDRSYWNCTASKLVPRTMDTIFIDHDQKNRITEHIDQWLSNESMYTERGLLYKTGILLHGPAGTGKSSMAMAIANYLGCGLITIDPGTFQYMNIPEITESIVADETKYVVLIDEIDAIFKSREDKTITDDQVKVTNKLLSFLDSAQSPTGVIFVATTNYPERLDKSLLRKGRFDIVEEMGNVSVEVASEMCYSFNLSDEEAVQVLTNSGVKSEEDMVNPAILQDAILTFLKKKNQDAEEEEVGELDLNEVEEALKLNPDQGNNTWVPTFEEPAKDTNGSIELSDPMLRSILTNNDESEETPVEKSDEPKDEVEESSEDKEKAEANSENVEQD